MAAIEKMGAVMAPLIDFVQSSRGARVEATRLIEASARSSNRTVGIVGAVVVVASFLFNNIPLH